MSVSLWDMMTGLSGSCACAGAVVAAKLAGGGGAKLTVGWSLGIGLGLLALVATHKAGLRVLRYLRIDGEPGSAEHWLPLLYVAKFAWMFFVCFGGFFIAREVLHLAFSS